MKSSRSSHEPECFLHRQSPVSGLLSFINSVGRRNPSSMEKLRRTYEDVGQQRSQCSTLTVLQWNVLADGLAQNGDFQRVQIPTLPSPSRTPLDYCTSSFVAQLIISE